MFSCPRRGCARASGPLLSADQVRDCNFATGGDPRAPAHAPRSHCKRMIPTLFAGNNSETRRCTSFRRRSQPKLLAQPTRAPSEQSCSANLRNHRCARAVVQALRLTCPPRLLCRPLTKIYKGPPEEGVETGISNGRKLGFCDSANWANRIPYPLIGGYGTTTSGGPFCFFDPRSPVGALSCDILAL